MRFDCGRRTRLKQDWHVWFAWHPVEVGVEDCRWLEYVYRKGTVVSDWEGGTYWEFDYKPFLEISS